MAKGVLHKTFFGILTQLIIFIFYRLIAFLATNQTLTNID